MVESLSADERLLSTRDSCECHKGKGEGRTRSGRRVWAEERGTRPMAASLLRGGGGGADDTEALVRR